MLRLIVVDHKNLKVLLKLTFLKYTIEQVAKQFMSQSTGWADNIVFAMAPLGIITAVTGAIRVGGPTWLKAVIGYVSTKVNLSLRC